MKFFLSNPTPFDWFMVFLVYLVVLPASIYMTVVYFRLRREQKEEEKRAKKFIKENPHLFKKVD